MQTAFGYPMTIAQLNTWGQVEASALTLKEVGRALDVLDRIVTIKPAPEPKEWR